MKDFLRIFTKLVIVAYLLIPALSLTILIWILGGWTIGWQSMPNPVYELISWLETDL